MCESRLNRQRWSIWCAGRAAEGSVVGSAGCKAAAAHQTDKVGVMGNEQTRAAAQLALGGPGSEAHKQGWSEPKMRAL